MDSTKWDSSLVKTSYSVLQQHFSKVSDKEPEVLLTELSKPVFTSPTTQVNSISDNLSGELKDYLKQQLTFSTYLADSSCRSCAKLKTQTEKVQQNISKHPPRLERLRNIQADMKTPGDIKELWCENTGTGRSHHANFICTIAFIIALVAILRRHNEQYVFINDRLSFRTNY